MVNGYNVTSLKEALDIRSRENVIPYGGGTDLMVEAKEDITYLFLNKIPEMKKIVEDNENIYIGAACTFTDVLESDITPAILKEAVSQIAAPAIRNFGTVGGNICNGSPKGDSALIFFATECKLRLASNSGERIIPISEFFVGRNKTSLKNDELLVEIIMKKTGIDNYYFKKIGPRNALAISRVSFAGILDLEDNKINNFVTAFGAVDNVIFRRKDIDAMLIGKTIEEAKAIKEDYIAEYSKAITPIRGRVSAEYRKNVCMNLLKDFLESNGI
jgi:xanthine dehydrogenase FAD-binding subunit